MDYSAAEVEELLGKAARLKSGAWKPSLAGKTLAMLFQKNSTRTRASFEAGMTRLGGHAMFMDFKNTQLGRGETIHDTIKCLERYCDAIMARLNKHDDLEEMARHASVPVINGLTDLYHPCQTLADILTVAEKKGGVKAINGLKLVFLGDCGFNMFNSTAIGFSKLGCAVTACCPNKADYLPNPKVMALARKQAKAPVVTEHDVAKAVQGADVLVTDTWVSMGQENEEQRVADLRPFQLNAAVLAKAKKDAIVLHCLPAHRGQEITGDVIDGPHSVVFDEAENRLHAQNAVLATLLKA